ncbi:MAG: FecR domain-containing protein, partial [Lachnospiraceae bacterium]|nr:FecR domain-containing protein [Lachnospiraceae bacterium]
MKKWMIFGGAGAGVVAVVVALILILGGRNKAYRSIIVVEVEGKVSVTRDGNSYDAYPQMKLRSGDAMSVPAGGYARLKLDGDKFVYLDENSKISLQAAGTAKDSKTIIYIEQGSMLTEIKNKLSKDSSYDVVTPNTTMAIRGTITQTVVYRIEPGTDISFLKDMDDASREKLQTALDAGKVCYVTFQYVLEGSTVITAYYIEEDDVVYTSRTVSAGSGL